MMRAQIDRYLTFRKPGHNPVQISFYGGTFLGLAPQDKIGRASCRERVS
jgi:hypothetical protein